MNLLKESIAMSELEVHVVDDQGEPHTADTTFSEFKQDLVYLVIDHDKRKIYVWKGPKAPVRQKFTSARAGSNLRMKLGMTYKIDSLDAGIEGRDFLALWGLTPQEAPTLTAEEAPAPSPVATEAPSTPVTSGGPVVSTRPSTKGGPVVSARPAVRPSAVSEPTPSPVTAAPRPVSKPVQAPTTAPEPMKTSAPVVKSREVTVTAPTKPVVAFSLNDVENKLKELGEPEGMVREIVIVGDTVFSVIKEYLPLFDKEVVKLEPMSDLPEGAFPATDYETRILIGAGGNVIFVELLRQAPESERDEFVTEMKRSLKDLTKLGI